MILHNLGLTYYETAMKRMKKIHKQACKDKENHLILTQHHDCFTIGQDAKKDLYSVTVFQSDRGGSVTCHSKGQNIYYFCFQTPSPINFFRNIKKVFSNFFTSLNKPFYYDKKNPGFYIGNKKVSSLGFRYTNGVSLHGVSINVDVDLSFHRQIQPCGLPDIEATSLYNESVYISSEEVNRLIVSEIVKVFHESL